MCHGGVVRDGAGRRGGHRRGIRRGHRGDEKHLFAEWSTYGWALALAALAVAFTLVVLAGWAAWGHTAFYTLLAGVLSWAVVSARTEVWPWGALALGVWGVGVLALIASWVWGPLYESNHLRTFGSLVAVLLLVGGDVLMCPSFNADEIESGPLAVMLIVFGVVVLALGLYGGTTWDIQVFGVSTGILIGLAGLWMLLSEPSSGAVDASLLWWAYGAWFLVMSLATLYIPNGKEPKTMRTAKVERLET